MKYGPVLEDILLNKSRLIEESKSHNPIVKIEKLLETTNPPPEFKSIFHSDSVSLIAEIKRSSAAAGKLLCDLIFSFLLVLIFLKLKNHNQLNHNKTI